ncbi:DUF1648 domain-containing protein [Streptomyces sp. NPDC047973]|uniref:DUF1648 domain-containing protein n=1 Tax=Streptomyces sp. NPDC047973 TaxID=3155383 RepID=UPI00344562F3
MNKRIRGDGRSPFGLVGWAVGVLVLLVGMPVIASGRLPERLATHWNTERPDGSMPLWAAAVFPALAWVLLVVGVGLGTWRTKGRSGITTRGWEAATLLSGGALLVGGQASIVRANLDQSDWRQAGSVTGSIVTTLVVAVAVGLVAWLMGARGPGAQGRSVGGPRMNLPGDQRVAWFSRTSNPWLHALATLTGIVALAAAVAALADLTALHWPLIASFALASVLVLGCASVQAMVSEEGLKVSLGPLGWPVRRWAVADVESAYAEDRSPAQVGGWGYRLSGMGTTVMLRGGECLVVRAKGKTFAVSVDDAERGAALLNSLSAGRAK